MSVVRGENVEEPLADDSRTLADYDIKSNAVIRCIIDTVIFPPPPPSLGRNKHLTPRYPSGPSLIQQPYPPPTDPLPPHTVEVINISDPEHTIRFEIYHPSVSEIKKVIQRTEEARVNHAINIRHILLYRDRSGSADALFSSESHVIHEEGVREEQIIFEFI